MALRHLEYTESFGSDPLFDTEYSPASWQQEPLRKKTINQRPNIKFAGSVIKPDEIKAPTKVKPNSSAILTGIMFILAGLLLSSFSVFANDASVAQLLVKIIIPTLVIGTVIGLINAKQ